MNIPTYVVFYPHVSLLIEPIQPSIMSTWLYVYTVISHEYLDYITTIPYE